MPRPISPYAIDEHLRDARRAVADYNHTRDGYPWSVSRRQSRALQRGTCTEYIELARGPTFESVAYWIARGCVVERVGQ